MNVESVVGLAAIWSRGDFLDRCRHLVLSEQMSRHGRVRGRGCRKPRTRYAERTSVGPVYESFRLIRPDPSHD
jgi:hypothetical protein